MSVSSAFPQLEQAVAGQVVSPLHDIVFIIINIIQAAFFLTLLNNKLEIRIKNHLIPPESSALNPESTLRGAFSRPLRCLHSPHLMSTPPPRCRFSP